METLLTSDHSRRSSHGLAAAAAMLLLASAAQAQQQVESNAQFITGEYFAVLGTPPDYTGWAYSYQLLQAQTLSQTQVTNYFLTTPAYFTNCAAVLNNNDGGRNTCPGNTCVTEYPSGASYPTKYSCQANINPSTGFLDNQDFLTLLYWDALSRAPDPSGWTYWYTDSLQASPPVSQATVVGGFILNSTEFGNDYNVTLGTVTPAAFSLNGAGSLNITYSAPGGPSYIGSGEVFIASSGDPTVYNSVLTGCLIEWSAPTL